MLLSAMVFFSPPEVCCNPGNCVGSTKKRSVPFFPAMFGSSDNIGIILQFTGRHFLGVHRSSLDLFKSIASDSEFPARCLALIARPLFVGRNRCHCTRRSDNSFL